MIAFHPISTGYMAQSEKERWSPINRVSKFLERGGKLFPSIDIHDALSHSVGWIQLSVESRVGVVFHALHGGCFS